MISPFAVPAGPPRRVRTIADVPVIDLDTPARVTSGRRTLRPPRLLALPMLALLLVSLPGEAGPTPSIFDDLCGYFAATDRPRSSIVLQDVASGEALQTTTLEVNCPPGR